MQVGDLKKLGDNGNDEISDGIILDIIRNINERFGVNEKE